MGQFSGKVALVTGGGSGIGEATAMAFGREGAKVVIGNRNQQRGEAVAQAIRAAGGEATFKQTDVQRPEDIVALHEFAVATYGAIDAAFNNAGIEGDMAPLGKQTEAGYDAVMDTNVKGLWLAMKQQINQMLSQGGGAIVNNSSVGGLVGFAGAGIYVASKHAVMGLTKSAALEYSAHGIRVNAVNPAVIQTGMAERLGEGVGASMEQLGQLHPIGRVGQAKEVGEAVLWLCSDKATFVHGIGMPVDGGFTVR
jgi:NAD(P)-dependent dehydrogenase (short-subunit alcohol dehydrogenase family)